MASGIGWPTSIFPQLGQIKPWAAERRLLMRDMVKVDRGTHINMIAAAASG
jgi:hypothetical protein